MKLGPQNIKMQELPGGFAPGPPTRELPCFWAMKLGPQNVKMQELPQDPLPGHCPAPVGTYAVPRPLTYFTPS